MQNTSKAVRKLAIISSIAAVVATCAGHFTSAAAGGRSQGHAAAGSAYSTHQSLLRIHHGEPLPQSRRINVGANKSMLVELPRELRDVVVSDPEVMDAVVQSSNRVYLIGKKPGQSNAFFFDAGGNQILTLEVVIERDTGALDDLFARLIPGSKIKTEILNDTIILTGSVKNPVDSNRAADIATRFAVAPNMQADARAKLKVINMLAVEGEEQVLLKVLVSEVQRSAMKQLGMNIGAIASSDSFVIDVLTENALPITSAAGLGKLPVPAFPTLGPNAGQLSLYNTGPTNAATVPFGNSGSNIFWGNDRNGLSHTLRMLERNGLLKTLAEPNLTAVSGEAAKFLAGGEFPIPVVSTNGQTSVTFKEFGVRLAFTPIVMSEGRISMAIETEVSELSNTGAVTLSSIQIPAIKKRTAKSTVELPSGGSLALAGLIKDDVRQNIDGLPGLKDVPVLGNLFRSRDFLREETEMVVIVTPYIVRPTARKNLGRPDDGLAAATEAKANFLGHVNRIYGTKVRMPDGGLKDDYGFIVE